MCGAAVFGLIGGVTWVVMTMVLPQPLGAVMFSTLLAMRLTWGAAVCWRRMRLPLATAAMAIGAATFGVLAGFAVSGRVFPDLPREEWLAVGLALVAGPLCLLSEASLHPKAWAQWRECMADKSAWDILSLKHIPTLR